MALKIDSVRQGLVTSPGTQDFTIAGFGTPVAAIFIMTNSSNSDGSLNTQFRYSYGATDGVREFAVATASQNAVASNSQSPRVQDALCVLGISSAGAVSVSAEFSAWITDGVRINVTVAPGAARLLTVILIGGVDATNVYVGEMSLGSAAGPIAITAPAFQPNILNFFGISSSAANAAIDLNNQVNNGWAIDDGSLTQGAVSLLSPDDLTTTNVSTVLDTANVVHNLLSGGSAGYKAALTSFDPTGFTLNLDSSAANDRLFYVAIEAANTGLYLAPHDGPSATGDHSVVTGGVNSSFIHILTSDLTAVDVGSRGPDSIAHWTLSGTGATSNAYTDDDAASQTLTGNISAAFIKDITDGQNDLHVGTLSGITGDTATLNFTTAPAGARKWLVLGIGDAVSQAPTITSVNAGLPIKSKQTGVAVVGTDLDSVASVVVIDSEAKEVDVFSSWATTDAQNGTFDAPDFIATGLKYGSLTVRFDTAAITTESGEIILTESGDMITTEN
jgi:hypothetical protein